MFFFIFFSFFLWKWDNHDYYQGGRFPLAGTNSYEGKIKYTIPQEDVPPSSSSHPDHFVRQWFIKVTAVIRMRKNLSVLFPISII